MKILDENTFKDLEKIYDANPSNPVIANAISNVGLREASLNREVLNSHDYIFSNEVKIPGITDQRKTGRCRMFAGLNMIRPHLAERLNTEEIELSESYLYFYDNMEKTNLFLQKVIDTKDKPLDDREVEKIFFFPPQDGGYFEFFYYLIKKYGIVPKSAMGETFHTEDSDLMFWEVERLLKKVAMDIRKATSEEEVEALREKGLAGAYNIIVKCLGKPAKSFDFKYYDKDKNFHIDPDLTPKTFFDKYIGDFFDGKVRIGNDPRMDYGRVLVDKYSKNATDLPDMELLNLSMDEVSAACQKSIEAGETMRFGCDVGMNEDRASGVLDENLFNYDLSLVEVKDFSKAERIDARFTDANHAMNLVGFDRKDGAVRFWKIENSRGEDNGKKGFFSMSDDRFRENTFEVIIDKKFLTEENLAGYEKEKIEVGEFDPFFANLRK